MNKSLYTPNNLVGIILVSLLLVPISSCGLPNEKNTKVNKDKIYRKLSSQNRKSKSGSKLVVFDFNTLTKPEQKKLEEKYGQIKSFWIKSLSDKESLHDFYVLDTSLSYKETQELISYANSISDTDRYGYLVNFKLYFDLEEYGLARVEVDKLLKHRKSNETDKALSHLLIGDTYLKCQRYKLALEEVDKANALKTFSNSTKFLRHQIIWYQKKSLKEATRLTDESCAHSLRFSGTITRTKQKPWIALKFYKKAEKLAPNDPRTFIGKSACFLQGKKRQKALEELNKTNSALDPKLINLEYRANLYAALSKSKLATIDYIKHFISVCQKKCITPMLSAKYKNIKNPNLLLSSVDRWIKENNNDSRGLHVKACILSAMNKPKLALENHDRAISKSPNEATYYVARAKTWLDSLKSKEALKDLDYAINKLNFQARIPLNLRGQAFMDLGDYQKAVNDFSACLDIDTDGGVIYYQRGQAYMQLKEPKKAEPDLLKNIELAEKNAPKQSCRNLAIIYDSSGEFKKALKYYNMCLENATGKSTWKIFQRRANLHMKLEDWQAAINDYSTVLKINKVASGAYFKRGKAYEKLGKLELAKKDLEKAKSMDDYLFGQ